MLPVSTRPLYIRSVQMAGPKLLNGSNADAPSVGTKLTASLINGSTAILPCHYTQSVYGIYWTKQNGHSEPGGDTLVHLDTYFHVGSRCGRGVEEGRFNISDDLSLIINPVKMHDGGRYSCKVSDITSGMTYSNDTDVTVYVYAKKKYVTIKPCEHLTNLNQSEDLRETPCAYDVPDNQTRFQLNCSVSGAMPKVSLTWMTNGTNVGMHYDLTSMSEDRGDGTFDQTLVITGSVNETRIGTVLTCMAKGLSVGGLANSSVIFVKTEPQNIQPDTQDTTQKPHVAAIVVPIIVCLVLLAAAVGIVWNRRSKQAFLPFTSPTKVSDDAVWTSPQETFWIGQTDASLNCSFQGTPIAVYWLKGETLQTAMPLITWYKGKSTKQQGEGLEFGPNFSLLFNHPNTSDTGRYSCRVSNQQGILNSNHTDLRVLDPKQNIMYTIPEIIGWKGKSVILPCDFQGTPSLVSWTRERSDEWNTSVQTVAEFKDDVSCKTEWIQYACSRGYGLIITNLKLSEEANFTCTVVKTDGAFLKNTTSLSVYAKADHPYPHVDQCEGEEEDSSNRDSTCIIRVTHTKTS
ncbi:uncharacterized protein LOC105446464 isoform X2 [Strongylocentrotus purpuratus]|uniref:Ig-like domain-containing protein n=1 Tax=Strongylocentrotus purpuratus TaxID=7668 RepID=A0A7M7N9W7_STRPU|nr:uncharacterized protein LOC105446464 isoform X2 [Strongylocentrotus purpuratus]